MKGKMESFTYFECLTQHSVSDGLQNTSAADAMEDGINAVRLSLTPAESGNRLNGTLWVAVNYNGSCKCALAEISASSADSPQGVAVAILQGDPEISYIRCEVNWEKSSLGHLAVQLEVPGYELSIPLSRLR